MDDPTTAFLIDLNRRFYQSFGHAFASTRRRLQPGVERILTTLPAGGDWLDLGCGSGTLAARWAELGRTGSYSGLDFSPTLLQEAQAALPSPLPAGLTIQFALADLTAPDWAASIQGRSFNGVLFFAVLHHLPGEALRRRLLAQVRALLPEGALFIHSVWQFQRSPRLVERIIPWEQIGLSPETLEPGDFLLDWRQPEPGQQGQPEATGLRYVHVFSQEELASLAEEAHFSLQEQFDSDGHTHNLSLYQVWKAV